MSYTIIQPQLALKNFISHFWVADWSDQTPNFNSTYFVTANSMTEVAFGFRDNTLLFSTIQGQTNKHCQITAGGVYQMLGVTLYSYAIPFLFHLPTSELNNLFLSPETILGNEGKWLNEKIALSTNMQDRIDVLTNYFKYRLDKHQFGDDLILNAAKRIRNCKGNLNITELSDDFCLSQKQLERRFKANTGFNPKLYTRIVRFETALTTRADYDSLTKLAHAHGYYDQAHFIHEFKTFAGYSPNRFFALSGY